MRAQLLATAFLAIVPVSCCCLQCGPLGCKPLRLAVSPAWAEHQLGPGRDLTPKASVPLPRIVTGTVTWPRLACRAAPTLTPPWATALRHSSWDHPAQGVRPSPGTRCDRHLYTTKPTRTSAKFLPLFCLILYDYLGG